MGQLLDFNRYRRQRLGLGDPSNPEDQKPALAEWQKPLRDEFYKRIEEIQKKLFGDLEPTFIDTLEMRLLPPREGIDTTDQESAAVELYLTYSEHPREQYLDLLLHSVVYLKLYSEAWDEDSSRRVGPEPANVIAEDLFRYEVMSSGARWDEQSQKKIQRNMNSFRRRYIKLLKNQYRRLVSKART